LKCFLYIITCSLFLICHSFAQTKEFNLLSPSEDYNQNKVKLVIGSIGTFYTGSLILFNQYWYKEYPRSKFHFFNDSKEWNHVDKVGHVLGSYQAGLLGIQALRWAGVENKKTIWYGGCLGSLFLTNIEILDGFSEKWGASVTDLAANSLGSFIAIYQQLKWDEQKVKLKFSSHNVTYDADVNDRALKLYGNGAFERILKDYNGQTYWASINIESLDLVGERFPKWLNIAIGYGAEGMLGGFVNQWNEKDNSVDRSDIPRYRQYYLSLDIDLSRIHTKSKIINSIAKLFNFIKIPAPTIEYNRVGKFKLHSLYF